MGNNLRLIGSGKWKRGGRNWKGREREVKNNADRGCMKLVVLILKDARIPLGASQYKNSPNRSFVVLIKVISL